MPYRQMPDRLYDDPDELAQWAARALAAAQRRNARREASPRECGEEQTAKRQSQAKSKSARSSVRRQATAAAGAPVDNSGSVSQTTRLRPARFAA